MHFSLNADQLDDLVIIPMPNTLQILHLLLYIVQFNIYWFIPSHFLLLGELELVCGTFLQKSLLGGRRKLGNVISSALDERCKPDTRKRRHEGVRIEERHLTTMVWKT